MAMEMELELELEMMATHAHHNENELNSRRKVPSLLPVRLNTLREIRKLSLTRLHCKELSASRIPSLEL